MLHTDVAVTKHATFLSPYAYGLMVKMPTDHDVNEHWREARHKVVIRIMGRVTSISVKLIIKWSSE